MCHQERKTTANCNCEMQFTGEQILISERLQCEKKNRHPRIKGSSVGGPGSAGQDRLVLTAGRKCKWGPDPHRTLGRTVFIYHISLVSTDTGSVLFTTVCPSLHSE